MLSNGMTKKLIVATLTLLIRGCESQSGTESPITTSTDDYDYVDECGRTNFTGTSGVLRSPGYPGQYPNNFDCTWNIQTPENTRIALRFEPEFEIEEIFAPASCYDYIQITGAGTSTAFCGSQPYPSILSDTNEITVRFFTDLFVSHSGFSMNWTAIDINDPPDEIRVTSRKTEGIITSPNYPGHYSNFLVLSWIILAPADKVFSIEFDPVFDIEPVVNGTGCPYDVLAVARGSEPIAWPSDDRAPRQVCGNSTPSPFLVGSNEIRIEFRTDIVNKGVGFSLLYTIIDPPSCNGFNYMNGTSGKISSLYYPDLYPSNQNCTWHIKAPEDKLIVIKFERRFQIQTGRYCQYDCLKIFDGPTTASLQYQRNFCGIYPPRAFLASGNEVTVVFISDDISNFVGFSLNWTTEDACNSGEFRCWDETCINQTKQCDGIYDCPNDDADEATCALGEGEEECGRPDIAPEFKWDARIIGGSEAKQGSWPWQVFIAVQGLGFCGAVVIDREWIITAAHCVARTNITAYIGDHNRTDYDMEREQRRMVDRIVMHPFYNHIHPQGFGEGYDIALMHLDRPVNFTTWVKPVCLPPEGQQPVAGEFAVISGWGRSDFFHKTPSILRQVRTKVLSDEECSKRYPRGNHLLCMALPDGGASSCSGDSGGPVVQLVDDHWEIIGIVSFGVVCGQNPEYPSAYAKVVPFVPFIQEVMESSPGENEFEQVIRASSGSISTPGYGAQYYPSNVMYRWFIIAPADQLITVRFNETFFIESVNNECIHDYLAIYDGSTTQDMKYRNRKLCGDFAPPDFESSTNVLTVEFYSDEVFGGIGFYFDWNTTDNCAAGELRCFDQSCIEESKKCDGNFDCSGKKDEMECVLAPQLDSTECGKATVAPNFKWYPLIVGGHDATEGAWPWQIGLYIVFGSVPRFYCGGTLLNGYWALTAAHCVNQNYQFVVAVGDHDRAGESDHEMFINVTSITGHPDYEFSDFGNGFDLALLRLADQVDFKSRWVKPICMPAMNDVNPPVGSTCVLTGWGSTLPTIGARSSDILQQVQLTILDDAKCVDALNAVSFYPLTSVPDNLICAGHTDHNRANACFGDSGGPLQCLIDGAWHQYGITSFGPRCGERSFYERVSSHFKWINDLIAFKPCEDLEIQNGTSGVVKLPIDLQGYESDAECAWLIQGPPDTVLQIQFEYVDIESSLFYPCKEMGDALSIYDGGSTNARKFQDDDICGENITIRGFESSSNELFITFTSNNLITGQKGFKINWEAVADCSYTQSRCWNGDCVGEDVWCDSALDCADDSDEMECPHPYGACSRQDITPDFLWAVRIVGGMIARPGSWPWHAGIVTEDGLLACSGAIIGSKWIMTAAYCNNRNVRRVVVGASRQSDFLHATSIGVLRMHSHPNYVSFTSGYDIAILELEVEIQFNVFVQPICMPSDSAQLDPGDQCIVTGWGRGFTRQPSDSLRQLRIPVIDDTTCAKYLASLGVVVNETFEDIAFCGGYAGAGTCEGDWGGPLMCFRDNHWQQLGIVTYDPGCGQPGIPSFFTDVSFFRSWINNVTDNGLPSASPAAHTTTTTITATATETATVETSSNGTATNATLATVETSSNGTATNATLGEGPESTTSPTTTSASLDISPSYVFMTFALLGRLLATVF